VRRFSDLEAKTGVMSGTLHGVCDHEAMIALDTNILIYAHRQDATFHRPAARCVTELPEGRANMGGRIHDARIAARCRPHGVREVLVDRDFSRFPNLGVASPLVS